ncbi:MAG: DUF4339 domain-containing protein [Muribaculaceae bacterium]|nr:DUF4339 domain-containing protein [Muribaculaceae bacterium]
MRYYIYKDQKVMGPYEVSQLSGLTPESQVCVEGGNEWCRADSVPEISAILPEPAKKSDKNDGAIGIIASFIAVVIIFLTSKVVDSMRGHDYTWCYLLMIVASIAIIIGAIYSVSGLIKDKSKTSSIIGIILNDIAIGWATLIWYGIYFVSSFFR